MKRIALLGLALLAGCTSSSAKRQLTFDVTVPAVTLSGTPVAATLRMRDQNGATVTDVWGAVQLTSSDPSAVLPAQLDLARSDQGVKTVQVTFTTPGTHTLTATFATITGAAGSGTTRVCGLAYSDPPAGGRVRLVVNAAASTPTLVQLDLVSNALISPDFASGIGGVTVDSRNGAFAIGFNLPLDAGRVAAAAPLILPGEALALGDPPRAVAAALPDAGPAAGVLLTGVSQKRSGAGAHPLDHAVAPGAVYYSVRLALRPGATPGLVFDGATPQPGFRAALRDHSGSTILDQPDFSIGRLEVR